MKTPRENLLSLLRRQGYDEHPVEFTLCPSLTERYRQETGGKVPYEDYFRIPLGWIIDGLKPTGQESIDWSVYYREEPLKPGSGIDFWGVGYEKGSAAAKHMTHMRHPLEKMDSLEQLRAYPFPDYTKNVVNTIAPRSRELQAKGLASIGCLAMTIWERAFYLRGMEQLMMDMMSDDPMATYLLDTVTAAACAQATALAQGGVDMIQLGDDIGMQRAMMMNPALWREWLKPRLAQVIAAARSVRPDLLIWYHSCGYIRPVIGELAEIGIDVLNPVQPECMDFAEIFAEFGGRIGFWGTLGTQSTMPFGTPAEVRATVFKNLTIAGPKGGLFCAPTHLLEPEVPWENILAYVQACRDFTR